MQIKRLFCANFRNIKNIEFFPEKEMNVICGENAQGKTNIIEAIWLFTGAKSFRASKENSYIKIGESNARCEIDFISGGIENNAAIVFGEKKTAYFNDKKLSAPSRLAGNFSAVIFSPNDLSLVKDGPNVRRKFIDTAIGQLYPNYIEILHSYYRAMSQRNSIIKDYKYDGSLSVMLDVFEKELTFSGKKIIEYRKKYLSSLMEFIPEIYFGLSNGREKINVEYIQSTDEQEIAENLLKSRKNDSFLGVTSVGPHRDDIIFSLDNLNAREYASQGQKRSIALALKLAQAQSYEKSVGECPVCLLDDVMSELDPARQNYILNHIKGRQSFITCCDPSNTKGLIEGKIINVDGGNIKCT